MKGIECFEVISFNFSAVSKFSFSLSITQGPAIKKKQFFLSLLKLKLLFIFFLASINKGYK